MTASITNQWSDKLNGIIQITRMDKPIGTYLLLWPTLWALWLAADGFPGWHLFFVFTLGVFVMRSAGCVINDFADRNFDGQVKRTSGRPLVSGLLTSKEALLLFFSLLVVALGLGLTLTSYTLLWAVGAVIIASAYPFMKRYTHYPQVVLGAAFSWGIPMAFAQLHGQVPLLAWLIFFTNLLWTVAYDTMYAMVDRDDDLEIGIKSTAIAFGRFDKLIIAVLQLITLGLLIYIGRQQALSLSYYLGVLVAAVLFIYQQYLIRHRERQPCFVAFLNNHYAGMAVFGGIFIHYLVN
jgi:4-hydroxybenzoate polyprenyltransferase